MSRLTFIISPKKLSLKAMEFLLLSEEDSVTIFESFTESTEMPVGDSVTIGEEMILSVALVIDEAITMSELYNFDETFSIGDSVSMSDTFSMGLVTYRSINAASINSFPAG